MSTIAIIGGTGFTGAHLAAQATDRGHQVVALSRNAPASPVDGVRYLQGDAGAAADGPDSPIVGADIIIGALSPRAGSEGTILESYRALAESAARTGARFVVVGGFSSLRPAPGAPRFAESGDVPEAYLAEAKEMNSVLEWLQTGAPDGLDWLFISPAGEYGGYLPQGEPRGSYRTSGDVALFAEDGTSTISGADFALAILDTIEAGQQHRAHLHFAY